MMFCVSKHLISHLFDGLVFVMLDLGWMNRSISEMRWVWLGSRDGVVQQTQWRK